MKKITTYKNGNTWTTLYEDGTKARLSVKEIRTLNKEKKAA